MPKLPPLFRTRSMRARLLLQIVPGVALAVVALTIAAISIASEAQKDAVYDETSELIAKEAARFDTRARASMTLAQDTAALVEGGRGVTDRRTNAGILRRLAERHENALGIWVAFEPDAYDGRDADYRGVWPVGDPRGRYTTWAQRLTGTLKVEAFEDADPQNAWFEQDYYTLARDKNGPVVVEPYLDEGVMMTSYATSIRRGDQAIGTAGVDVALDTLDKQAKAVEVLDSGYAFVASDSGSLLAFPARKGWAGKKTLDGLAKERKADGLRGITAATKAGKAGHVETVDPVDGREAVLFYAPVTTGGWSFVAVAPKDEILASVNDLRITLLLVGLLALVLISALVAWVAGRISRPVREVAAAAEQIGVGDLDVAVAVRTEDEVGRMAAAFGEMAASLREKAGIAQAIAAGDLTRDVEPQSDRDTLGLAFRDMTAKLRAMVGAVSETAGTLTGASGALATSSDGAGQAVGEIAHAVEDVAAGAERQVQAIESVRATGQRVAQTAREGAEAADGTVQAAADAREIAEQGALAASAATAAMDAVRTTAHEATETIRALGERSARITDIVDAITGIAEQTNLLALNAAIEAARAGEQGRGFAVVAEEVRKLAEESQQAAGTIAELIGEIQSETARAVEAVEAGAARTEDGVATVEQANAAFGAIRDGVDVVDRQAARIAHVIAEIESAAVSMAADLDAAAEVAESSSAATEEVSASVQETSSSTQEIASSAQQLAGQAGRLNELVGQFGLTRD
jgi:methyl-accepting chemotaxis protein